MSSLSMENYVSELIELGINDKSIKNLTKKFNSLEEVLELDVAKIRPLFKNRNERKKLINWIEKVYFLSKFISYFN